MQGQLVNLESTIHTKLKSKRGWVAQNVAKDVRNKIYAKHWQTLSKEPHMKPTGVQAGGHAPRVCPQASQRTQQREDKARAPACKGPPARSCSWTPSAELRAGSVTTDVRARRQPQGADGQVSHRGQSWKLKAFCRHHHSLTPVLWARPWPLPAPALHSGHAALKMPSAWRARHSPGWLPVLF